MYRRPVIRCQYVCSQLLPKISFGQRNHLAYELYQTLFDAGTYTESDDTLRRREVWPCEINHIHTPGQSHVARLLFSICLCGGEKTQSGNARLILGL